MLRLSHAFEEMPNLIYLCSTCSLYQGGLNRKFVFFCDQIRADGKNFCSEWNMAIEQKTAVYAPCYNTYLKEQVQTHWWRSEGLGWLRTSRWPWCCLSFRLGRTAVRPCCPGCRCSSPPLPCVTAEKHLPQSCDKPQTQSHYGSCGAAASPPERPAAAGKKWEVPPSCCSPYLLSYSSPQGDSRYRKQKKESYA